MNPDLSTPTEDQKRDERVAHYVSAEHANLLHEYQMRAWAAEAQLADLRGALRHVLAFAQKDEPGGQ